MDIQGLGIIVLVYSYFKKGCYSQQSILEPKGTLGTVLMSDNLPAKVVTILPWQYMMNHAYFVKSMLTVISYLCCLNPTVPFGPVSTVDYDNHF